MRGCSNRLADKLTCSLTGSSTAFISSAVTLSGREPRYLGVPPHSAWVNEAICHLSNNCSEEERFRKEIISGREDRNLVHSPPMQVILQIFRKR